MLVAGRRADLALRSDGRRPARGVSTSRRSARIAGDRSLADARGQLTSICDQINAVNSPDSPDDLLSAQPLAASMVADVRGALLVVLGAVGFVLLIACANVAGLLDRARCRAPPRNRCADGTGRRTRPPDAAASDREPRAGSCRRGRWAGGRVLDVAAAGGRSRPRTFRAWTTSRSTGGSRCSRSPPRWRSACCSA